MIKNKIKAVIYRLTFLLRFLFFVVNGRVSYDLNSLVAPSSSFTIEKGAKFRCGKRFALLRNASLILRKNAYVIIGNHVSIGIGNFINIHEKLVIGNNVVLAQDVKIYDHDHDVKRFSIDDIKWRNNFITAPVQIGNNVWIGSNVVILKGTIIGDNSVVAAGSVLNGVYPPNSIIIQKRETTIININHEK